MSKNNYSVKFIFVIVVIISSILITGCSNNESGLSQISNFDVIYTVLDESDNPIEGALVSLDGTTKTTDSNGLVNFSKPEGSYDYSVIVPGYDNIQDAVVVNGNNLAIEITLILPTYDINFTITDTASNPIQGATITLDSESKDSDSNGKVTFSKPDGSYDYNISINGYETIFDNVFVSGNNVTVDKNLNQLPTDEFNITFSVTDNNDNSIKGANVSLDGVNQTTDSNGMITFTKPDGTYNYTVTADNYNSKSDTVVVNGANVPANISLTLSGYNIIFTVKDSSDTPIEGANVSLDSVYKSTDSNGTVIFIKEDGSYNYNVTATNYVDIRSESITVNGSDLTETVSMQDAPPAGYIGIYNWKDLDNIRNDLYGDYILMNDLDSTTIGYYNLASSTANGGLGWLPIGNSSTNFKGKFDGNSFTIYNLYINRPNEEYIGLFGYGYSAELVNINMNSITIKGKKYVGSIIGSNRIGNINSCNVIQGAVNGNSNTGGIAGYIDEDSIIQNSIFNGEITGIQDNMSSIGGIVGHNFGQLDSNSTSITLSADGFIIDIGGIAGYNNKNITNCHSQGTMTITSNSGYKYGGLVGLNHGGGTINNSYSTVDVTVTNSTEGMTGGLVGQNNDGSINNSYSSGTIDGTYRTGGLVGYNTGNVANSYSTSEVIGTGNVGGLIGFTAYGKIENCYSMGVVTGTSNVGGLLGQNTSGDIYDSICKENPDYEVIGVNFDNYTINGRVTEASQTDMQNDDIYTEITLTSYDDMNVAWDTAIWDFGSVTSPAYPSLSWE